MGLIARNQIDIYDTTDGVPFQAFIIVTPNPQQTLLANQTDYQPEWKSANGGDGVELRAYVYKSTPSGAVELIANENANISNIEWKVGDPSATALTAGAGVNITGTDLATYFLNGSGEDYDLDNGTTSCTLTIDSNIDPAASSNQFQIFFECDYTDPVTLFVTHLTAEKTMTLVENGLNGVKIGWIEVYKWAATQPVANLPTGNMDYTWADGTFVESAEVPVGNLNSWSVAPSGTFNENDTLWGIGFQVIEQSPAAATTTQPWLGSEVPYAIGYAGAVGANGSRVAILDMYQWATSTPTSYPQGDSIYTWASATFTDPDIATNGWTRTPDVNPPNEGEYLYIIRQIFVDIDGSEGSASTVTWSAGAGDVYIGGGMGPAGPSSTIGILTNESHSVPTDSNGNNPDFSDSGTNILVYEGTDILDYDGVGTTNGTWTVSIDDQQCTSGGASIGGITPNRYAIIANLTAIAANTAYIDYTISGKTSGGVSFSFDKRQTFNKAKAGGIGDPADYLKVTAPEQVFKYDSPTDPIPVPTSITLTATLYGNLTTYDWEYWDGSIWSNLSGTQNTSTYALAYDNVAWSGQTLRVRCLSEAGISDEMTLAKVYDGAQGDPGLSIRELIIYKRDPGTPGLPTGGSYNFDTSTLTPPTNWDSDIPSGTDPVWASTGYAESTDPTGTDSSITWSTPYMVFREGDAVDIIFKRSATQPAPPNPSSGTPATWYSDVDSVPGGADPIWSSVGTRANSGLDWTWQTPVLVEGSAGTHAYSVRIESDDYSIDYTSGSPVPTSVSLTATPSNTTGISTPFYKWYLNTDLQSGNTNSRTDTLPGSQFGNRTWQVELYDTAGTNPVLASDTLSLHGVSSGDDAITIILTNYAHVIANDDYTGSGTDIEVYKGATQLTIDTVTPGIDEFKIVSISNEAGITEGSISQTTGQTTASVGNHSNMTVDTVVFDITLDIEGTQHIVQQSVSRVIDGSIGLSIRELTIYDRSPTTPSPNPPTGGSYNFGTSTLTPPTNWSSDIPSGTDPVYASTGYAESTDPTGTDSSITWSTAYLVFQEGTAVDIIFTRSETQPDTPIASSGVPAGWYTDVNSVPGGAGWIWSSVGTRSDSGKDWTWQTPVQIEGSEGDPGLNAFVIVLSNESDTVPVDSGGGSADYTGTGTDINVWFGNIPCPYDSSVPHDQPSFRVTSINDVGINNGTGSTVATYTRRYADCNTMSTDTAYIEFTIVCVDPFGNETTFVRKQTFSKVYDGADSTVPGPDGYNTATVYAYQRNANLPTTTPNTMTYTFSTQAWSTGSQNNGWYDSADGPSGTDPLWVRAAVAYSNTSTDTISTGDWNDPVQITSEGDPGYNSTVIWLYQRSVSSPARPSNTSTWQFSTASFTVAPNNSWSTTVPAENGQPCWVTTTYASSQSDTVNIVGSTPWQVPQVVAPQGSQGDTSPRIHTGYVYYDGASDPPVAPSADSYNWSTGVFSGLTTNWSLNAPEMNAANGDSYYYSRWVITEPTYGGTQDRAFNTPAKGWGFSGLVTFSGDSLTDGGGGTFEWGSSGTTTIHGDRIDTGTLFAREINISGAGNVTATDGTRFARMGSINSGVYFEAYDGNETIFRVDDQGQSISGAALVPGSVGPGILSTAAMDQIIDQVGAPAPATGGSQSYNAVPDGGATTRTLSPSITFTSGSVDYSFGYPGQSKVFQHANTTSSSWSTPTIYYRLRSRADGTVVAAGSKAGGFIRGEFLGPNYEWTAWVPSFSFSGTFSETAGTGAWDVYCWIGGTFTGTPVSATKTAKYTATVTQAGGGSASGATELNELTDVNYTAANNTFLVFNTVSGDWEDTDVDSTHWLTYANGVEIANPRGTNSLRLRNTSDTNYFMDYQWDNSGAGVYRVIPTAAGSLQTDDAIVWSNATSWKFATMPKVGDVNKPIVPSGGASGYVLTKDSATDYYYSWQPADTGSGTYLPLTGGVLSGALRVSPTSTTSGISFDSTASDGYGGKRITWNDGGGNFQIRGNNYYNTGEKFALAGAATRIRMDPDGAPAQIYIQCSNNQTDATADTAVNWGAGIRIDGGTDNAIYLDGIVNITNGNLSLYDSTGANDSFLDVGSKGWAGVQIIGDANNSNNETPYLFLEMDGWNIDPHNNNQTATIIGISSQSGKDPWNFNLVSPTTVPAKSLIISHYEPGGDIVIASNPSVRNHNTVNMHIDSSLNRITIPGGDLHINNDSSPGSHLSIFGNSQSAIWIEADKDNNETGGVNPLVWFGLDNNAGRSGHIGITDTANRDAMYVSVSNIPQYSLVVGNVNAAGVVLTAGNTARFKTTSTGATVHGSLAVTSDLNVTGNVYGTFVPEGVFTVYKTGGSTATEKALQVHSDTVGAQRATLYSHATDTDAVALYFAHSGTNYGLVGYNGSTIFYLRNLINNGHIYLTTNNGASGVNHQVIAYAQGSVILSYDGDNMLKTNSLGNSASNGIGATVMQDNPSSADYQPVGMNVAPWISGNLTIDTATEWRQRAGYFIESSGNYTYTVPYTSAVLDGSMWIVCNNGSSATLTIAAASGTTLYWMSGTGRSTGTRTIAYGGVATIYKKSLTSFHIWGSGIS